MKVSLVSLLPLVSFILGAVADNVIQIGCITISGVPADVVLLKYDYENFDTDRDQADQCGVDCGAEGYLYSYLWPIGLTGKHACKCSFDSAQSSEVVTALDVNGNCDLTSAWVSP
ncbi:hypothetical protein EHS25_007876 [Saitozyma podzolica]|uniref:Uncharacterized protein n=1 Tax=Saitozyma podzolica TaxID=1890683 RepID=A0A427YR23_9TREE|nr:hypothetical protein EHS25_007876 [Saitozyma podzolica]